jgi:N-acyl-D-amino-acid deacylase
MTRASEGTETMTQTQSWPGWPARAAALAAAAIGLAACAPAPAPGPASEPAVRGFLITHARIVDGTGAPARDGAVRVRGGVIEAVGAVTARPDETVVDAHGLVLAPGFIDTHSHHDAKLDEHPDALVVVSQGVTTIVVGQDGESHRPLASFFDGLRAHPAALNVASYVGHGTLRERVLGKDYKRRATAGEVERMRLLLVEDMAAGGLGLSTGLEYDPGLYSSTDELVALAAEAGRHGGRYISHVRSEDRGLWQAIDEAITIGRDAHLPVQISHMKLAMTPLWGKAPELLARLDAARAQGIDVTADVYPYEYWQSTLAVLFPERNFDSREAAEVALRDIATPDGIRISRFDAEPALVGKTLAEIARERGQDPATTLLALVRASPELGETDSIIGTSMAPADVAALTAWPHANVCSDGQLAGRHPRGAGAFTRVLRLYVREQKLLTLEEAVRKMTGLAAAHMGFTDRGLIRPGLAADLVLFDPVTVSDRSTIEEPLRPSEGIARVWVNGTAVYEAGHPTGARPGRPILHGSGAVP